MKLVILHYHLRPGGVRRIIELATQHLVREAREPINSVVLASGEPGDETWNNLFRGKLSPTPVHFIVEPVFRYVSEQATPPRALAKHLEKAIGNMVGTADSDPCVVWAHNLGIGRNLLLTEALIEACAARQAPLLAHHHDWWFDNRWRHWHEMQRCGFRSLARVADTVFSRFGNLHHITINQADARLLQQQLPGRVTWLPNLTEPGPKPRPANVEQARRWLQERVVPKGSPVWLLPGRILRRKNIAEALLLTRWLRPGAWLCGTAGVSSPEEQTYAAALQRAASRHHWPLRLGLLEGRAASPSVEELMAASEVILMTSIQEGFGLPYLEAAAASRPLLARSIPNVAPDLKQLGFKFPQMYQEVVIAPTLFNWTAERKRQEKLFRTWRRQLPRPCHAWAGMPMLVEAQTPRPVPFSRLTLTAQLAVLAQPVDLSWKECAPLNPFQDLWRDRAEAGKLQTTSWPETANQWLTGQAYAQRFWKILRKRPKAETGVHRAVLAQELFIRRKLVSENLFPLLWARQT